MDTTAGDIDVTLMVDGDDLVFNQYDGTEVMRITDTSRVGIGTDSPQDKLDVELSGDSTKARFWNGTQGILAYAYAAFSGIGTITSQRLDFLIGGNAKMSLSAAGLLGIGTVSPTTGSTKGVHIENTTTNASSEGGCLRLSANDDTVMVSTDRLGVIEFAGAEDTSSTITVGARIEALADATWSATENGAHLDFYTTDADAAQTLRMTILATGDIGMGVAAPTGDRVLHIKSSKAATTGRIENAHGSTPYGPEIVFSGAQPNNGSQYFLHCSDGANRLFIYSNGGIANFQSNDSDLSDRRLKKNIVDAPSALSVIDALTVRNFKYIDQTDDRVLTGLIAQEVEEIDSSLVNSSGEFKMIYNKELYHKMLKAVQELSAKVTALENA